MVFNCYGFWYRIFGSCGVAWLLFGCFYDFLLSVSELFRLVQFPFCNDLRRHLHKAVSLPVHIFEYSGIE